MSVTIPGAMLKGVQEEYKSLYLDEFGPGALSEELVPMTEEQTVAVYAQNVAFWRKHLPSMVTDLDGAARHAVCSNAVEQLLERARHLKIEQQVLSRCG